MNCLQRSAIIYSMVANAERAAIQQAPLWSETTSKEQRALDSNEALKRTQRFIWIAISEGAYLKTPNSRYSLEQWQRDLRILAECTREDRTDQDIAEENGISRQAISQIKNITLLHLWRNSSSNTQELFPFEKLSLHKPVTITTRIKMSEIYGGITLRVRTLAQNSNSRAELVEKAEREGISRTKLRNALSRLEKSWGIDMSHTRSERKHAEDESRLRNAVTFKEKQQLLEKVTPSFYKTHNKGDNPLFISITKVALSVGLRRNARHIRDLLEVLKTCRVPFGKVEEHARSRGKELTLRYYFILFKDMKLARQAFLEDPRLNLSL